MVFSSTVFLFLFLPVVLATYFLVPRRLKNVHLLLASWLFYAWGEQWILVALVGSSVANWAIGLWIHASEGRRRRVALAVAVVGNLLLLGVFKYFNFAVDNVNRLLEVAGIGPVEAVRIALPIGISFFTFQALSYVIDVYRGTVAVQRDPLTFALYIALFPQLIAGPIVRYSQIATGLVSRRVTREGLAEGVGRFIVGLGKKMLLANTTGEIADQLFAADPRLLPASTAWLGIVAYTLQAYFDFSGYSDMAIGLGRAMGFRFPENFRHPYVARSIRELWTRWHITLTTWLRDYVYIPLGGNRRGPWRTYVNLMTVFVLCGLWHGASWTFVVFGVYQGVFLVLERQPFAARVLARAWRPLEHAYTMLVWIAGLVLFRAESVTQAWYYWVAMAGGGAAPAGPGLLLRNDHVIALVASAVLCLPWVPALRERLGAGALAAGERAFGSGWRGVGLHAAVVTALLVVLGLSALQLAGGTHNPFIYFRF